MKYYVYILSNKRHTVYYVGVTSNLIKRIYEHKMKFIDGFTKKYNINKLHYYEQYQSSIEAIKREKQIKGYRRAKKLSLINIFNSDRIDLYNEIID
ncbi:GIY-YIG nuclease family protein [Patescibacteria group bacterium]